MVYVNSNEILARCSAKGMSLSGMAEFYDIANGVISVSSSQIKLMIEVLAHLAIAKHTFVCVMLDAFSKPPSTPVRSVWDNHGSKPTLEIVKEYYADEMSPRRGRIVLGNLLKYLGISANFSNSSMKPVYPSHNNIFHIPAPIVSNNIGYVNDLKSMFNPLPISSPPAAYIEMVLLYGLIIELINILNPTANSGVFQVKDSTSIGTLGLTGIYNKTTAINQIERLMDVEKGGYLHTDGKYYTDSTCILKSIYQELLESEPAYLALPSATLNLSPLATDTAFQTAISVVSGHQNLVLSKLTSTYTGYSGSTTYFTQSMNHDANFLDALLDVQTAALSALSTTTDYMIPYYNYLVL